MYQVTIATVYAAKLKKPKDSQTFSLGEPDTSTYEETMSQISNLLFDMDIEFDEENGDGDMVIDDILISIAEEETFEKTLSGKQCEYRVKGQEK